MSEEPATKPAGGFTFGGSSGSSSTKPVLGSGSSFDKDGAPKANGGGFTFGSAAPSTSSSGGGFNFGGSWPSASSSGGGSGTGGSAPSSSSSSGGGGGTGGFTFGSSWPSASSLGGGSGTGAFTCGGSAPSSSSSSAGGSGTGGFNFGGSWPSASSSGGGSGTGGFTFGGSAPSASSSGGGSGTGGFTFGGSALSASSSGFGGSAPSSGFGGSSSSASSTTKKATNGAPRVNALGWRCPECWSTNPWAWKGDACRSCTFPKPAGIVEPPAAAAPAATAPPSAGAAMDVQEDRVDDMADEDDDDDDAVRGEDLDDDDVEKYSIDHDFDPKVLTSLSAALHDGGTRCLGAGSGTGACGMGDDEPAHVLPEVISLSHTLEPLPNFVRIRASNVISAAIDEAGQLWTWGECENGALGRIIVPSSGSDCRPGKVDFPGADRGRRVADVSMGSTHMVAVLDNGHCYTWGAFDIRGVWKGHHVENRYPHGEHLVRKQFTPWLVHLSRHPIVAVASGDDHFAALDSHGYVFMQGLIDGVSQRERPHAGNARLAVLKGQMRPRRVFAVQRRLKFSAIAAGGHTVWAVDASGTRLYALGRHTHSQCGPNGDQRIARTSFVEVPLPGAPQPIVRVAGHRHVLVLRADGSVFSWGRNSMKILGYDTPIPPPTVDLHGREIQAEPEPNPNPKQIPVGKVLDIATGDDHTLLHLASGKVIGFGETAEYRMGNGRSEVPVDQMPQTIFEADDLADNNFILSDLAAGSGHSLFLLKKVPNVQNALAHFAPTRASGVIEQRQPARKRTRASSTKGKRGTSTAKGKKRASKRTKK